MMEGTEAIFGHGKITLLTDRNQIGIHVGPALGERPHVLDMPFSLLAALGVFDHNTVTKTTFTVSSILITLVPDSIARFPGHYFRFRLLF